MNSGFEYAKRTFRKSLGQPLPAWALLLSGSFGGVSLTRTHNFLIADLNNEDIILARVLSFGYIPIFLRRFLYPLIAPVLDVIKSRVQLSDTPPQRGLGYIPSELRAVVHEQGL